MNSAHIYYLDVLFSICRGVPLGTGSFPTRCQKPTTTDFTFAIVCIYLPTGTYRYDAPISHERKFVVKFSPALECTSIFFGKKKTFNDSSAAAARKKEKAWRKRPDPLFFWFFGNPPTHPTYLAASHTQLCSVE